MMDLQKPWPLGLSRKTWPLFLLAILAGLLLLSLIDIRASRAMIGWSDSWRAPFFFITEYGLSDWTLIPSLVVLILARLAMFGLQGLPRLAAAQTFLVAAFVFVGVGAPGLLTAILKRIIGRARPTEFDTSGAFAFQNVFNDWTFQSFPSGHSATAVAIAFTGGFLWPRLFPVLLAIGLLAAFSRVPVGMHYPTDVFGGIIVGMLGAYLARNVFASRSWLFRTGTDGRIRRKPMSALLRLVQRRRR